MKGIDILVAVLAIALVVGTIFYNVRKKMRGDNSCGYNCEGCPGCKDRKDDEPPGPNES